MSIFYVTRSAWQLRRKNSYTDSSRNKGHGNNISMPSVRHKVAHSETVLVLHELQPTYNSTMRQSYAMSSPEAVLISPYGMNHSSCRALSNCLGAALQSKAEDILQLYCGTHRLSIMLLSD